MSDPYKVVRDFEAALCEYTGAKYAVTTTSCTSAILLAMNWKLRHRKDFQMIASIPSRTYISVPMSILNAGGRPVFRDEDWIGEYEIKPWGIIDSARWFRRGMFKAGTMQCLSFHWTKHLAIGQGGAILHDNDEADEWLRRMRFDGRKEGLSPKDDTFTMIGHHCYMSPRDAAEGLSRLAVLPEDLQPLPNSDYPNLSAMEIFK